MNERNFFFVELCFLWRLKQNWGGGPRCLKCFWANFQEPQRIAEFEKANIECPVCIFAFLCALEMLVLHFLMRNNPLIHNFKWFRMCTVKIVLKLSHLESSWLLISEKLCECEMHLKFFLMHKKSSLENDLYSLSHEKNYISYVCMVAL